MSHPLPSFLSLPRWSPSEGAALRSEQIRKFRYLLYQQHQPLEVALQALGDRAAPALREHFDLEVLKVVEQHRSRLDPSIKLVLQTHDGHRLEAVLIRAGASRSAVCVSTQVGCRAGCPFCATARMGLRRDLAADEIVAQVLLAAQLARQEGRRLRNIVFMGMGEPLHNESAVHQAIRWLTPPQAFNLPARRISVSTVGIPDAMRRLIDTPGIQVALSCTVHVPNSDLAWYLVARYEWSEVRRQPRYGLTQNASPPRTGDDRVHHD